MLCRGVGGGDAGGGGDEGRAWSSESDLPVNSHSRREIRKQFIGA